MLNQKEKKQILHIILLTLGGLMILFGTLLFFLTPIPTETLLNTSFHNYQWTGLEIILLKIAALFTAFWGIILVKIAKKPEQNLFLVHLTIVFFTLTLLTQFWALYIPQIVSQFNEQFFLTRIIVLSILVLLLIFLRPRKEKNVFKILAKKFF